MGFSERQRLFPRAPALRWAHDKGSKPTNKYRQVFCAKEMRARRGLAADNKGAAMTIMALPEQTRGFAPYEIERMARQLVHQLQRTLPLAGDCGDGTGIFSAPGRGDGSLNDSIREAEPDDDIDTYADEINACQSRTEPLYVNIHANRFERRGVFIPDILDGQQMGDDQAVYTRGQVASLTVELMLWAMFLLERKPGLILPPQIDQPIQVLKPGSSRTKVLRSLRAAEDGTRQNGLAHALREARWLRDLEFIVVVSDLLSPGWQNYLVSLGQQRELIVFQIIDRTDIELPDINGCVIAEHNDRGEIVDMGDPEVRKIYRWKTRRQQARIAKTLRVAGAQHYRLLTGKESVFGQLMDLFGSRRFVRRNT